MSQITAQDNLDISNDSRIDIRQKILRLQDAMLEDKDTQVVCEIRHIFAPGVYAREMTIPKGVVVIGKIHKHRHMNIVSKGKISVMTEFGPAQIEAPCTFVSEPGTKRAGIALEETVWTTIHPTEETDLEKIEAEVIAKNYEEIGLVASPVEQLNVEVEL